MTARERLLEYLRLERDFWWLAYLFGDDGALLRYQMLHDELSEMEVRHVA